jgi:hypothetical protein
MPKVSSLRPPGLLKSAGLEMKLLKSGSASKESLSLMLFDKQSAGTVLLAPPSRHGQANVVILRY